VEREESLGEDRGRRGIGGEEEVKGRSEFGMGWGLSDYTSSHSLNQIEK
jgi:hypothetical protein